MAIERESKWQHRGTGEIFIVKYVALRLAEVNKFVRYVGYQNENGEDIIYTLPEDGFLTHFSEVPQLPREWTLKWNEDMQRIEAYGNSRFPRDEFVKVREVLK